MKTMGPERLQRLKELMRVMHRSAEDPIMYPLYNPDDYLDTGARFIPLSDLEAEVPVRKGRWDHETGTVVYEDGQAEISAVRGVACPPKKAERPETKRREHLPDRPKSSERIPKISQPKEPMDIRQDQRRDELIRLYLAGQSVREIVKVLHIGTVRAGAILADAGILRTKSEVQQLKPTNAKVTTEQVREIRKSTEPVRVLAERFALSICTVRRIKRRALWAHIPDDPTEGTAAD